MMRRWALLGVLLGGVLAVVVHAPATWLAAPVTALSAGRADLVDARGTVWQGDARLLLGDGPRSPDARLLPGRVSWHLTWGAGAVRLALRAECCMQAAQTIRLLPSWGSIVAHLDDGGSQWPAALLVAWGAPWNSVQPEGELRVRTQGLSVEWSAGRASLLGQVQVDALAMASRLSTLRPVGSYRLTLAGQPGTAQVAQAATLQLQTLEGPLRLAGSGQWAASSGWRFSGEAKADAASESALGNLLNMVGRRQGDKSVLSIG